MSSFVFHSSLLTVKRAELVVARDGFLCTMEIVRIFHSGYFDYRGAFQQFLIHTAVYTADREGQWMHTSVSDDNLGTAPSYFSYIVVT